MNRMNHKQMLATLGRFDRPSFVFALGLSAIPQIAFRVIEPIIHSRGWWSLDIVALGIFFVTLVVVTWRARSVVDYALAVATAASVHTGFFLLWMLDLSKSSPPSDFNPLDDTVGYVGLLLSELALVIALLSLPVFLIRRMKSGATSD